MNIATKNQKISIGGLMRCCIDTLERYIEDNPKGIEAGTIVFCKYESVLPTEMILQSNGIWKWNN